MPKIFISYRRTDSRTFTDRIYDRLVEVFGSDSVFQDVDDIPPGADFRVVLSEAVQSCDIVLVMIGPQWAGVTDAQGRKRLFNTADFVRIEVQTALNSNKLVIPVLIEGASPPTLEELPESLHELAYRNAITVRHNPDFSRDMERLARQVKHFEEQLVQRREVEEQERQRQAELEAQARAEAEEQERQRIAQELAQQKADAEKAARIQAEAEEKERQRLADIEAQEKAEANELERQRLEQEAIHQKAEEDEQVRLKAIADEKKRQRKAQLQAEAVEKARQRRIELETAEYERQAQTAATTPPRPEGESFQPAPFPDPETYTPPASAPDGWQHFFKPRRLLIALAVVGAVIIPIIQKSIVVGDTRIIGITRNADWTPVEQVVNGVPMVKVPSGCFVMGSTSGGSNELPPTRLCFEQEFWIDKTEVTNAQFVQFNGQAAYASNWTDANRPRENITWFEAGDFCGLRGGRLPTEAEWEYAVRGPDNLTYPWGNDFDAAKVVYADNSNAQTADVGSKTAGASWVGALDMSGNVWEWVSTVDKDYPYPTPGSSAELQQWIDSNDTSNRRILRGGAWNDSDADSLRAAFRDGFNPDDWDYADGGFRCVVSAPFS